MPISIDLLTHIISIPQSYCTLISGTLYELDTEQFREDLIAWQAGDDGIVETDTHIHNTEVTVVGITYARFIEMIAPWSVQFTPDSQWSVRLAGSNNNIFDVEGGILVQNQVQVIPGNAAGLISSAAITPQDAIDIADAIAAKQMSEETTPGSFFGEVATKADVAAATSTDEQPAASGSAIYGTVTSGDYTSTFVRDGTYWQIEEDAIDGLTVEMTFNLPSTENRAGVFSVFGRYTGNPAPTHYLESWAYNYAAAVWELLVERCMPGGNTDDATYNHEYYERHIDRDNNNEVKIRLVHNVTSYSASHFLYLDYVELSSIRVSTPIFNIGASMSDDDTTARFVMWGERESNIDMTLTGMTAELFSYDGTPVTDLGAGTGPDAQGCFEFSCASALLPANTALYVNVISTDGNAIYYSNAGVTRIQ